MRLSALIIGALITGGAASFVLAQAGRDSRAASIPVLVMGSSRGTDSATRATVTVNGKPVFFEGTTLFQIQGRLLVPLRSIGEVTGAVVSYDPATQTVTAIRAGYTVRSQGGTVIGGRLFVPLRTLSEGLGIQVSVQRSLGFMKIALDTSRNAGEHSSRPSPTPSTNSRPYGDARATSGITPANIQYNLTQLNALRAKVGVPLLKLDAGLNAFALQGSLELMRTHIAHGHFKSADVWDNGFQRAAAENQGDPNGWFPGPINRSIDEILRAMMSEGPGGGHHDNIVNPAYRRVGIGLAKDKAGRLYLTNDFSG